MSDKMDVEISEFLDGELEESRLSNFVERCVRSDEMKRKLSRYAVARDSLRRLRTGAGADLADRVMAALADEPVVLAPRRRHLPGGARTARVLRPAAGLAVAATVATMAVLGLRGDDPAGDGAVPPQSTPARQIAADAIQGGPRNPNLQYADANVRTPVAEAASARDRAWLNDYLLRHNEATGFVGRSGFMPYVHIVTTEPGSDGQARQDVQVRRVPVSDTQPE